MSFQVQDFRGNHMDLPEWARGFRIALLIFSGLMGLVLVFLLIGLGSPMSLYDDAGRSSAQTTIWLGLIYLAGLVPFLLAHAAYVIAWLVALRGKGYRTRVVSRTFLIAAPVLAVLSLAVVIGYYLWQG